MPANTAGLVDFSLEIFGGIVTNMTPTDLPAGVSPDCQNVQFFPGGMGSRDGLTSIFSAIAGNPTVNYIKTSVSELDILHTLIFDSAGNLWQEDATNTPGALSLIQTLPVLNSYAKSDTAFGREYIAVSDGKFGNFIPLQYDYTHLDRVSQVGPGGGQSASDATAETGFIISAAPNSANRFNNVVTIVTTTANGYVVGQTVTISGSAIDPSLLGTFQITAINGNASFSYASMGANVTGAGDGTLGGGETLLIPQVVAGNHQVTYMYVTRQGYITAPAPPVVYAAAGGFRANVQGISVGPSNVVARIVAFTPANIVDNFYYSPINDVGITMMVIPDNTTTTLLADFTDVALISSNNIDDLFDEIELGDCLGVVNYSSRMFWWGERNKIENFLNLTFDGGIAGSGFPLGWTTDVIFGAGGSVVTSPSIWGDSYQITATNVLTGKRGLIFQTAYQDFNGVQIISPNTRYSVRVWAQRAEASPGASSALTFELFSVSLGGAIATATVTNLSLAAGTTFKQFIVQFGALTPATIPTDLELRVYVNYSATAVTSQSWTIDDIQIFPTNVPFNLSLVRASYSSNRDNVASGPESFAGTTGFLQVNENDGWAVKNVFRMRGNLYIIKEHGIYQTQDDGINEPNQWAINEISKTVGTESVNGVDVGEDWAVIASRDGLYIFWGGEPIKISEEIQFDAAGLGRVSWNDINWAAASTLWVKVDTINKRILIGAPIGNATSPNTILYLSYIGLFNAEAIATAPPVHVSSYSGKMLVIENSRKWSPWTISANAGSLVERNTGQAQIWLGNGAGTGKVYNLDPNSFSDDGTAINSYYTPHFFFDVPTEQALQLGPHRKLYQYMTMYINGVGSVSLTGEFPGDLPIQPLATVPLRNPAPWDTELPLNMTAERATVLIEQNAVGQWWKLSKFVISATPSKTSPLRGRN